MMINIWINIVDSILVIDIIIASHFLIITHLIDIECNIFFNCQFHRKTSNGKLNSKLQLTINKYWYHHFNLSIDLLNRKKMYRSISVINKVRLSRTKLNGR